MQTSMFYHPEPIFLSLLCFFCYWQNNPFPSSLCYCFYINFSIWWSQTHLILFLFYKYPNQWNERTRWNIMRRKSHQFFIWKFFFQYSDIYQHCLKGFTLNFLFLFFLWIKAIAWFIFLQTKLLFHFILIGFIFILMTAFSTAILNQYWLGTLWPTICLSDQLNENIDMIGCTEQVFFIIVITFKRCMLLELVSALTFRPKTSYLCFMSKFISEEIHTPPPPPSYPLPPKKERIEQNFYTTVFFKMRFQTLHILPFFPQFSTFQTSPC